MFGSSLLLPLLSLLACVGKGGSLETGASSADDTACTPMLWTLDLDGDGWAGDGVVEQCDEPTEYAEATGDCADDDAQVHPGADEVCDGVDNDCDGELDPPDQTWYTDADGDGYGDAKNPVQDCAQPDDAVADATDCDDSRDDTWPGAAEVWYDGVDQDCEGGDDYDADGDGEQSDEHGGVDCADWDASVGTFAEEVCGDYVDEDCDGAAEACPLDALLTFDDADLVVDGDYTNNYYGQVLSVVQGVTTSGDGLVVSELEASYIDGDEVHIYSQSGSALVRAASITMDAEMPGLGYAIHGGGDFSGDGESDLALWVAGSVYGGVEGAGDVYVFSTPVSGPLTVDDADLHIEGSVTNSWWGYALTTAFDWGVGEALVAIGGPMWDYESTGGTVQQAGRLAVISVAGGTVSTYLFRIRPRYRKHRINPRHQPQNAIGARALRGAGPGR